MSRPSISIQKMRHEPYVKLVPLSSSQIAASQLPRSASSTLSSTNQTAQASTHSSRTFSRQPVDSPKADVSNLTLKDQIPASQVVGCGDPSHTLHLPNTSDAGPYQDGMFPSPHSLASRPPLTQENSRTPRSHMTSGAEDPYVSFTNLLGSMHSWIHEDLWAEYMGKSFNLLMAYVNQSARLREVENQQKDNRP